MKLTKLRPLCACQDEKWIVLKLNMLPFVVLLFTRQRETRSLKWKIIGAYKFGGSRATTHHLCRYKFMYIYTHTIFYFCCWGFHLYDAGLFCIRVVLHDPQVIVMVELDVFGGLWVKRKMGFTFIFVFFLLLNWKLFIFGKISWWNDV